MEEKPKIVENITRNITSGEAIEDILKSQSPQEVLDELKYAYKELNNNKDKPVLVFDTCIHTGESMRRIVDAMEKSGFVDVRIGLVSEIENESAMFPDFSVFSEYSPPIKMCYPFHRYTLVEKTRQHIYSRKSGDSDDRKKSIRLREEIRKIIKERLDTTKSKS